MQAHPQSKGKTIYGDGGGGEANLIIVESMGSGRMRTTQALIAKLEFKPKYSMHVLPPRDQVGNSKGKNVTTKIVMVEFRKQLPAKKCSKKTRTMYA
jgi:hypothetical protein